MFSHLSNQELAAYLYSKPDEVEAAREAVRRFVEQHSLPPTEADE